MKFEYFILNTFKFPPTHNLESITDELNRLGSEGWELVSNMTEFKFVFKREILRK